jgi:UDP-glucose 4-epimerase
MTNNPVAIVTGGAGFIGSHMVDVLLAHGYAVRVIDNMTGGRIGNLAHVGSDQNLVVEEADICDLAEDASLFKDAKYVFHFAGIGDIVPSIESPTEYMATNVIGTAKVLECARAANVKKLVYAASSSC